jgi:hypothetical protein
VTPWRREARSELERFARTKVVPVTFGRGGTRRGGAGQAGEPRALAAALRRCATQPPRSSRPASHAVCQRDLRHHSSQAAQDRGARARQRPPHQDRDGVGLPRSQGLGRIAPQGDIWLPSKQ